MSTKEKASQFILKVPAGIKIPAGITGHEVSPQHATAQLPEAPTPVQQAPVLPASVQQAPEPPAPVLQAPGPQQEVKVTESYLSAKLRQSEQGSTTKTRPVTSSPAWPGTAAENDKKMADMWQEMEEKISFRAPKAAQLPADFLRSMGLDGETILISPKAVEALKGMLGGKKNG